MSKNKNLVYDCQIVLDALIKYTNLPWSYDETAEIYLSPRAYEIVEISPGEFAADFLTYDRDTGFYNEGVLNAGDTLANIINHINQDLAQDWQEEFNYGRF